MIVATVYGPGGYDPDLPNGNVVERILDNGNGTGEFVTYDTSGVETSRETISLPTEAPPPPTPTAEERIAELEAQVAALIAILEGNL